MGGTPTFPPFWQPPWPGWPADPIVLTVGSDLAPSDGIDLGDDADLPGWALPAPPPHPALPLLASPRDRVTAHLIDLLVLAPVMVPLSLTGVFAYVKLTELDAPISLIATTLLALMLFWVLIGIAYAALTEGRTGQTLGKRVVGIRVVKDDGRPIGWTDAQTRWLFVPADHLSMVGLTLISTDPLRQRLGDRAAGTIVVRGR